MPRNTIPLGNLEKCQNLLHLSCAINTLIVWIMDRITKCNIQHITLLLKVQDTEVIASLRNSSLPSESRLN